MQRLLFLTAIISLWLNCAAAVSQQAFFPNRNNDVLNAPFSWNNVETVFAFGDSYTNIVGEYGSIWTWDHFYKEGTVLRNPIIRGASTASGPNWIEYLTGCLEGLPQNCTPSLFDLAYGGATVDGSLIPPVFAHIRDLRAQIQEWQSFIKPAVSWSTENTLVIVWIGINDISNSRQMTDQDLSFADEVRLYMRILDVYMKQLEVLYDEGLRQFMLLNVPPMDRAPSDKPHAAWFRQAIAIYNALLRRYLDKFRRTHRGVRVLAVNAHAYFESYLDHAAAYGFKDIENYCGSTSDPCLPRYQYFWNNGAHPTYPVHKILADDICNNILQNFSGCDIH
ncbi:hypothetical protein BCR43DRAFT_482068 [Syncephalastrum racemosum]|uniref:GDSL lipase/esterase n=1 Tax=Syncephalastrum racemosum TaxID=13706 RepID=A0A1X2HT25_SYNRA|nr:hypothetical protein BCR43DRAFT_482068 [Syncephalastrum racemosum]